jgi:predicted short-subunit dehydrogenase-like oxidoreductase (DUF2520 family)
LLTDTRTVALVGPGRAGTALAGALADAGYRVVTVAGRSPEAPSTREVATRLGASAVDVEAAGRGAALVVVATPDAAIERTAREVAPSLEPGALVVHLSGALGLDVLAAVARVRADARIGALHPLQTLTGHESARVLRGAWAAVAGPPEVTALAETLGLRPFAVDDADRARYHAAACIASNHLVALLGQVQRVSERAGVPFEAFEPLARAAVDRAFDRGPARALTGPVARGDVTTVRAHLEALDPAEHDAYLAGARGALVLSGRDDPELVSLLEAVGVTGP